MLIASAQFGAIICLLLLLQQDLHNRLLPNKLVLAYGLLFFLYAASKQVGWPQLAGHLLTGALAFIVFFILFLLRAMGGGDVKLGATVFLWAGPGLAWPVTVIVAFVGGLVAVAGWFADRSFLQGLAARYRVVRHLLYALSARRGVPYGVALVAGGLFILG